MRKYHNPSECSIINNTYFCISSIVLHVVLSFLCFSSLVSVSSICTFALSPSTFCSSSLVESGFSALSHYFTDVGTVHKVCEPKMYLQSVKALLNIDSTLDHNLYCIDKPAATKKRRRTAKNLPHTHFTH